MKVLFLGIVVTGISFVDSTPIRVFKPKRIKNNKVFKGIATTGKSTMGWFLRIVINGFNATSFY